MEIYLLKCAGAMAIFFLFYKTVLENTSFHHFKRFYLLGSLLLSFVIPLIIFTTYIEVQPVVNTSPNVFYENTPMPNFSEKTNYTPYLLSLIYVLGVLFFGIRFGKNLLHFQKKIKRNPIEKERNFFHVLLKNEVIPHTFLNYIFLNKQNYEQHKIPKEVLLHEEAHALQKHTLDILLIEFLQVIFWFNPLFYFFKKSIQLNHEFLADRAVLKKGASTYHYQNIVLAFSSNAKVPQLAHSFNYSSIKKRFTVMKTQTSKKGLWLRTFLLFPLIALTFYGFSNKQQVVKEGEPATARNLIITILEDGEYLVNGQPAIRSNFAEIVGYFNQDIDKETRKKIVNVHLESDEIIPNQEVQYVFDALQEYGFYRLITPNQTIETAKGNHPFKSYQSEQEIKYADAFVSGAKKNGKKALVILVVNDNITINGTPSSAASFQKDIDEITKDWTAKDFKNAAPSFLFKNVSSKLHKKLNAEFKKTKFSQQKGGMELSPKNPPRAPEPPSAPQAEIPSAPDGTLNAPDAPKVPNNENIPSPPSPPQPLPAPDPAKTIIEMKEKGASFYWGPHKITPEEAVKMVRESKVLQITIDSTNALHPTVKLNNC